MVERAPLVQTFILAIQNTVKVSHAVSRILRLSRLPKKMVL